MNNGGTEMDSKYFSKHFIVEEVDSLDEIQCPYSECRKIFAADWKWFRYKEKIDGSFAQIHCPYCGKLFGFCV